jgi:hypothetical protein
LDKVDIRNGHGHFEWKVSFVCLFLLVALQLFELICFIIGINLKSNLNKFEQMFTAVCFDFFRIVMYF